MNGIDKNSAEGQENVQSLILMIKLFKLNLIGLSYQLHCILNLLHPFKYIPKVWSKFLLGGPIFSPCKYDFQRDRCAGRICLKLS